MKTSKFHRFNVNLQCGSNVDPRDDIALHTSLRVSEGYCARNTIINQQWGEEQGQGHLTIGAGQQFEILILSEPTGFKVSVLKSDLFKNMLSDELLTYYCK